MGYFSGYIFGRYLSAASLDDLSDITNRLSGFVRVYSKNNSISTGYVRCEILENRNNKIVKIESVASLWRHAPVIVFDAKVIYLFDKTKFIAVIFGNPFRVDGQRSGHVTEYSAALKSARLPAARCGCADMPISRLSGCGECPKAVACLYGFPFGLSRRTRLQVL